MRRRHSSASLVENTDVTGAGASVNQQEGLWRKSVADWRYREKGFIPPHSMADAACSQLLRCESIIVGE